MQAAIDLEPEVLAAAYDPLKRVLATAGNNPIIRVSGASEGQGTREGGLWLSQLVSTCCCSSMCTQAQANQLGCQH